MFYSETIGQFKPTLKIQSVKARLVSPVDNALDTSEDEEAEVADVVLDSDQGAARRSKRARVEVKDKETTSDEDFVVDSDVE